MARLMAASGARMVVGLDAGLAVEEAARRSREIPGLFWVQGDILRPPFRLGAFNRVISLGVLHHTMEPDRGFRAISDLVQDDGSLSVYVYHRDYYDWRQLNAALRVLGDARRSLIGEPLRRLIVKLPESARYAFCSALWERRRAIEHVRAQPVVGRALARILELSTPADVFKPLENRESNVARSYDLYSTPYNYSHDLVEVIDWFERDGRYAELTVTPYRISVTGFRGARGRNDALRIRYFASKSSEEVEASGIASAMTAD